MAKSARSAEAETAEQAIVPKEEDKAMYAAEEFAKASGTIFGRPFHQDIVIGAFKMAGKTEATVEDAAKIMSEFLGKEVRPK